MSPFVRRERPELSWSNRRAETLLDCEQAYFLRYYAAHNGWEQGAAADAREAWVLGKLTSLPQAVGMAVHRRAAECAAAIVAGRPVPDEADLLERSRAELNALYVSSRNRGAFLSNPKRSPMLLEAYYRGACSPEELERARTKLRVCTARLAQSDVWKDLRCALAAGGEVLVIDSLETFKLDGVPIYAAPDLAYRESEHGRFVIVDWKTGGAWDGAVDAIGGYALLVRDRFGWSLVDGACQGRVVCLGTGEDHRFALDAGDLLEAERRIRGSIARMRAMLADPVANVAKPWDAYRLNWRPWKCRNCSYLQACRSRITAEIQARGNGAA
jgi:hypothetical protein